MKRPLQSFSKALTQFAGNATSTVTISASEIMDLLSVQITIVTDANAANRYPYLIFKNEGGTAVLAIYGSAITANLTRYHMLYKGANVVTSVLGPAYFYLPLPLDLLLNNAWSITFGVSGGLAGDTVDVTYVAKIFPTG